MSGTPRWHLSPLLGTQMREVLEKTNFLSDLVAANGSPLNIVLPQVVAENARALRAVIGLYEFQRVGPVHAADFCGRVIAMWLRIRRW